MDAERLIKSGQEQLIAAWVGLINQIRIDSLLETLRAQDTNFERAMGSMEEAMEQIRATIATNRGGDRGLHGFIAEIAEVGYGNAKSLLHGGEKVYAWVNDNGPDDLFRFADGKHLQVKFVSGGGSLSLNAVFEHLQKYPDYLDNDGAYQIPRDFYGVVRKLYEMPQLDAAKLAQGGDLTYRRWKLVHDYIDGSGLSIEDLEPSNFRYGEVQKGAIEESMETRGDALRAEDGDIRRIACEASRPTLGEAAKVVAVSGVVEGAAGFGTSLRRQLAGGRGIRDLSPDDWAQIAKESGFGVVKGSVRGGSVYALNNYTATPAAVASALVTVSFGVAERANRLRSGEIDEVEFIESSELLCLDASVSALSAAMGQALIPVPMLGALIGNTVGMMLYQIAKDELGEREAAIAHARLEEQVSLDTELGAEYEGCLKAWREDVSRFMALLGSAFAPNPEAAFAASVRLADELGVNGSLVLRSEEDVDRYFLS